MKKHLIALLILPLFGNTEKDRFSMTIENALFDRNKSYDNFSFDLVIKNNTNDTLVLLKPFYNYIKGVKRLPWAFVYKNDTTCMEKEFNHYGTGDGRRPEDGYLQPADFIKILPKEKMVIKEKYSSSEVCKRSGTKSYLSLVYNPIIEEKPTISKKDIVRIKGLLDSLIKVRKRLQDEIEDINPQQYELSKKPDPLLAKIKLKGFKNNISSIKALENELTIYLNSFDLYNKIVQEKVVSNEAQIQKK